MFVPQREMYRSWSRTPRRFAVRRDIPRRFLARLIERMLREAHSAYNEQSAIGIDLVADDQKLIAAQAQWRDLHRRFSEHEGEHGREVL